MALQHPARSRMAMMANTVFTDIPAVYMSSCAFLDFLDMSSSLGSTNAPKGTTPYSSPDESTLAPLARACIPWPSSWTTIAKNRATIP